METVTHDGRETAYRIVGEAADGPGVLYVHGSGGSHRVWGQQYGPEGPSRPAIALDLSGHGDSADVETEAGPETLDAYADDVLAVAKATDASVLVGNSLGGAVVLQVLLERTDSVEGAVLLGSGAKLVVAEDVRRWLADDFERAVDGLHGTDLFFHDAPASHVENSKAEMRDVGRAVAERDFLTCHVFDVRERLGEIDVPVLALCGEHDRLTPPDYHEYLAEHLPDGRMGTVPGAAHLAMIESPGAVNDAIEQFLADLDHHGAP